jgi:hypothetical protein
MRCRHLTETMAGHRGNQNSGANASFRARTRSQRRRPGLIQPAQVH